MSMYFNLFNSASGGDFTTKYARPLNTDGWYLALDRADIYNSYHNVSSKYGNNTIILNWDATDNLITFPNGIYTVGSVNTFLQTQVTALGKTKDDINMSVDPTTGFIIIYLNAISLTFNSDFASNVGFEKNVILNPDHDAKFSATSTKNPQMNRSISNLNICCDIVGGSYNNDVSGECIYSFVMDNKPFTLQVEIPNERLYLPIRVPTISSMRCYITDNFGRVIDFNSEVCHLGLHAKKGL